jgi:hypothetical protein
VEIPSRNAKQPVMFSCELDGIYFLFVYSIAKCSVSAKPEMIPPSQIARYRRQLARDELFALAREVFL